MLLNRHLPFKELKNRNLCWYGGYQKVKNRFLVVNWVSLNTLSE